MRFAILLGAAIPLASAAVFDSIENLPRGWSFHRDARADEPIQLRVSLREQNLDSFEKLFWEISTPGHTNYGRHLEGHEVQKMIAPAEESAGTVVDWLRSNDIDHIAIDGSWVAFRTTVARANRLLGTKFTWYKNEARAEAYLRTTEYSVPSIVSDHIDFVSPTLKFPGIRGLSSNIHSTGGNGAVAAWTEWAASTVDAALAAPPNAVCNQTITPQCLLQLYNVHYAASPNNSKLAYASFLDEYARYTDLTEFETAIAMYAEGKNFTVTEFNGGGNDQTSTNDSTEANLDNQYTIGVAYPIPVTEFSTAGCGPLIPDPNEAAGSCGNEPYEQFLDGINKIPNSQLPQTLSVSYGEDEQTWPIAEATKVCNEFMKLGARGVSIMFASGDSGPGAICENNAGNKAEFVPNFPASCPYVTTVGATQHVAPEVVASFSGGGFSNYFVRPSYQDSAVKGYLSQLGSKFSGYYNASGRGYPDVAAQGVNFLVVDKGVTEPVDGTSCASPTFASVIALLNSARISSGQKPLGFLNPFLYSQGVSAFNDITSGSSTGCSSGSMTIPGAGWAAAKGWDAATGLGTPDFGKFLAIVAPKECNVGGVVPNPTMSKCTGSATHTGTLSVASSTFAQVTRTASTTKLVGKPTATSS